MGIIGSIGGAIWRGLKRAFTTAEKTTRNSVHWIWKDSRTEFRGIGRDFLDSISPSHEKEKRDAPILDDYAPFRRIEEKKAPPILYLIGIVSLVVATLYLLRLFDIMPTLREDMSTWRTIYTMVIAGFMFGQYIFHVMAVFKLSSGLKMAWASMMRTSFNYIILMIITENTLVTQIPIRMMTYPSWILVAVMVVVIVLMFLGSIRDFFTPDYAEKVSLKEWILYILYQDPFKHQDPLAQSDDA